MAARPFPFSSDRHRSSNDIFGARGLEHRSNIDDRRITSSKTATTFSEQFGGQPFVSDTREGDRQGYREPVRSKHVGPAEVFDDRISSFLPEKQSTDISRDHSTFCVVEKEPEVQLRSAVHEDSLVDYDRERTPLCDGAPKLTTTECKGAIKSSGSHYSSRYDPALTSTERLENQSSPTTSLDDSQPLVGNPSSDTRKFLLDGKRSASVRLEHSPENHESEALPSFPVSTIHRRFRKQPSKVDRRKRKARVLDDDIGGSIPTNVALLGDSSGRLRSSTSLHSAQYQARSSQSCSNTAGRARSGSSPCGPSGEAQRPSPDPAIDDSISGKVCGLIDKVRRSDSSPGGHVDHLFEDLAWIPTEKRQAFKGHTFTRRSVHTHAANTPSDFSYPLQQLNVSALEENALRIMMKPEVLSRFDALWRMISLAPNHLGKPPQRRLRLGDAKVLLDSGVIQLADESPTRGWIIPFSVVEDKISGKRRRFIAWPKGKNTDEDYLPDVPLHHVTKYFSTVEQEGAALFDLKASFYQVALPPEARSVYRMLAEDGTCYQLVRLPMGYRLSPEIMQLLVSTLAGQSSVVQPSFAAPNSLTIDVWIDNIRISGEESTVRQWTSVVEKRALQAGVTFGEVQSFTKEYTFIGVHFNHKEGTISVGAKAHRSTLNTPTWKDMRVKDLEVFASRSLFSAAILGVSLFRYYQFFRFVRLMLNKWNRKEVDGDTPLNFPPHALTAGEELRHILSTNAPRKFSEAPPVHLTTLATDASNYGWGAVLFHENGQVLVTGGSWNKARSTFPLDFDKIHISQKEARAVLYGLVSFQHHLPKHILILCDNTAVYISGRKGMSKSEGISLNFEQIVDFLSSRGIEAAYNYIRSEHNPADLPSRGKPLTSFDLAKWQDWRGGDADPWKS